MQRERIPSCRDAQRLLPLRFNDFITGARNLEGKVKPDYIIAEPVGSCTDLQATVIAPLKTIFAKDFKVAPLMVMVDTSRISSDEIEGKSWEGIS